MCGARKRDGGGAGRSGRMPLAKETRRDSPTVAVAKPPFLRRNISLRRSRAAGPSRSEANLASDRPSSAVPPTKLEPLQRSFQSRRPLIARSRHPSRLSKRCDLQSHRRLKVSGSLQHSTPDLQSDRCANEKSGVKIVAKCIPIAVSTAYK